MPQIISRPYSKCKKCHGNGSNKDSWGIPVGLNSRRSVYLTRCSQCEYYRKQDNEKSVRKAARKDANASMLNAKANIRMAKAMEEANRLKALELELLAKR